VRDLADGLPSSAPVADGVLTRLPVIVFSDTDSGEAEPGLQRLTNTCTVRQAHSPAVLLDAATYFLHVPMARLPDPQRQDLLELERMDRVLAGRKVMIVDDDMRNIFALSAVLEEHNMAIVSADNGHDAIRILQEEPDIEIVLMDIMMPELDGIETVRAIRKIPRLKDLPIVAVTAKAMKGDREKCIQAGAWDYLAKPVDPEQVLAVLRSWLQR
jgi:CheY-like chemotaxis protein